jgi:hypothetical protein
MRNILEDVARRDPRYAAVLEGRPPVARTATQSAPAASGGPGTELAALLASLGIEEPPGCRCKAHARMMDEWGADGCVRRRGEILEWITEAYAKTGYFARAKAAALAVTTGLAKTLDWADPAGSLLDEAVRRARSRTPLALPSSHRFGVRDCLYHLYPLASAGAVWRRVLGMLLRRSELFTGLRVISCMTGSGLERPSVVREMARPHGFEVVEVVNDPSLREVKTLLEVLPRFETRDPSRALFLGHGKGVTRPDNRGVTCHPWAAVCHEVCLDYWPLVESQLRERPVTGPFKKPGRGFKGSSSSWHYSGSFSWSRSADLFGRDWRQVDRKWFGIESYSSLHYAAHEAGCLFHEAPQGVMDLYKMAYLREVLVEYAWWRAEHEHERATVGVAVP